MRKTCTLVIFLIAVFINTQIAFAQNQSVQDEINTMIADLANNNFAISFKAMDSLVEMGEPVIPYVRILYNTSNDAMTRNKAVQVLRRIGGENTIQTLLKALEDSDGFVRDTAVNALSDVGQVAVDAVQGNLIVNHHYTSKTTIELLRKLGQTDSDILAYLIDEMEHRRVTEQKYIARIIGEIGLVKEATPQLLEIINNDSYDFSVRLSVLQTLAKLDLDSIPLETWILALTSESISNFERLFWMAMDTFANAGATGIPILRVALGHQDPEIRARASFLLGSIGEEARIAYPELQATANDEKWYVQQEAISALEKLGYQVKSDKLIMIPMEQNHAQDEPVVIKDLGGSVELSNGILRILITKSNVRITRLEAYGKNILGTSGRMYFDFNGTGGYWNTNGDEYQVIHSDPDMVHIMLKKRATTGRPFEIENHFVLQRGDSGFYSYVIFRHNIGVSATLEQTRHVLRVDQWLLPNMIIGDHKQGTIPSALLFNGSENVADATDRLADGSVYSKYNWAEYEGEHHVHGMAGDNIGVWSISASNEYLNGGPTKQNLTVHHENVLLRMLHSGHYGSGKVELPANSGWEKIYGPYYTYVNIGENLAELWIDAKRKAEIEVDKWPYGWLDNPLYPLERGQVTGTLNITDGSSPNGAWVILAQPGSNWQTQGKDYIFWSRVNKNGDFKISNVRPGKYSLYAYGSGVVGEFSYHDVTVKANQTTDLEQLNWKPLSFGTVIWEIGIPNRSAEEFFIPREHYRHWGMWEDYTKHFEDEPRFIIGESDYNKDWLYAQYTSVPSGSADKSLSPREIVFDLDEEPMGEGVLTILIAGSAGASVNVFVNNTSIGSISTPNDASVYRSGIQGIYHEFYLKFDASLLYEGENIIRLAVSGSRQGLMYDYLRLEISQ